MGAQELKFLNCMELLSLKEAKTQGKPRYFTGKPCPDGHISERLACNRSCVECGRLRKAQWRQDNPEDVKAQKKAWVKANPERAKELKSESQKRNRESANVRNRRYAAKNREKLREKNAKWAEANPEKVTAKAANYRAQKLKATPLWADFSKIERAYSLCQEYREKGIDAEVDHIIPLQGKSVCGLHVQGNFQIIHAKHNAQKSNNFKEL